MATLTFPAHEIVGELEWPGSSPNWPVLATGVVEVPDRTEITLSVARIESVQRCDHPQAGIWVHAAETDGMLDSRAGARGSENAWQVKHGTEPLDLGFLRRLPSHSITDLTLTYWIIPESFDAVLHLAPGLRHLCLSATDLDDAALSIMAQLNELVELQIYGNRFSDEGIQQLAALQNLQALYMEERTISAAALEFAARLPRLGRLSGLEEAGMTQADISFLRARLPGVEVC